jgi:5'-3' exoribonuclease 1
MGIPFYFRVITQEYKGIIVASPPQCDTYYIDFNGMIHQAAAKILHATPITPSTIEEDICESTWAYLQECVETIKPKNVHICVDGVAPIAKMAQQRKRRYLSRYRHVLAGTSPVWDTNNITPGTAFMAKLQDHIQSKITEAHAKKNIKYALSAADEPGEGEHKIFAHLATTQPNSSTQPTPPNPSAPTTTPLTTTTPTIIYGLDADLIMLSLLSHTPGIYLMREVGNGQQGYTYLDVDKLRMGILKQVSEKYGWDVHPRVLEDPFDTEAKKTIESYLVLCFLLGNDFLPHVTSLSLKKDGHVKLLEAASTISGRIVVDNSVCMEALLEVLKVLQQRENDIFMEINNEYMQCRYYGRHTGDAVADAVAEADAYPMKNKDTTLATAVVMAGAKWRPIYYKNLFNTRVNDTKVVVTACKLFLTGITWTFAYYKREKIDGSWYYPYGYAPSITDLANTLLGSLEEFAGLRDKWQKSHTALTFVHPHVQLLTVLPSSSIPPFLQHYSTNPAYGLAHLFPTDYPIKTYLCEKLWQCVPVLPAIDIDLVTRVLAEPQSKPKDHIKKN